MFVYEVHLGRKSWALWVVVGTLAAMSVYLWYLVSNIVVRTRLEGVMKLILLSGAGLFQAFLAAMIGFALTDGRLRAGVYRVVLTETQLRVAYPPALFGRCYWGQAFTISVAQIERLVVDRYPVSGDEPSYSVQCRDGTRRHLEQPRDNDHEVWPRLFTAIRCLRPDVVLEDWTHTLSGRTSTHAAPGTSSEGEGAMQE